MSNNEMQVVAKIRAQYTEQKKTKLDELKELDERVKRPAEIFAFTFGTVGSLVLGTGMCLAMKIIGAGTALLMPVGIAVGLVGIAAVSSNYFLYKKLLAKRKKKYAKRIFELSDALMNA